MQNSSIFYNREIVLEMQIIACLLIISFQNSLNIDNKDEYKSDVTGSNIDHDSNPNQFYLILYLILHVASYLAHFFRLRDLKINGQPDINGVYSARRE